MGKQNNKPNKAQKNKNLKNLNTNRSTNSKKTQEEILAEMRTVLDKDKAESTKATKKATTRQPKSPTQKSVPAKSTKVATSKNNTKATAAKKSNTNNIAKKESTSKQTKTTKTPANKNSQTRQTTKNTKTKKIDQKTEIKKQEKATKAKAKKQAKTKGNTSYEKAANKTPLVFNKISNISTNYTKKQIILISVVSTVLLLFIFFISTIFALMNMNNDKIIEGVSVFNVDISNMSTEDAKNKINEEVDKRINTDIVFKHNDKSFTLLPSTIKAEYNIDEIIDEAYALGRYNNIFANNYEIIKTKLFKTNLKPALTYDYDMITEGTPEIVSVIEDGLREPSYGIDGTTLTISNGKDGYVVDDDELNKLIINYLTIPEYKNETIELPLKHATAQKINVDNIYNEIHKEAINASFTKEPYSFTPSQNGLDFAISIDEVKEQIKTEQEKYEIPLKVLYPEITNNDIGLDAFPDALASYSTNYASSNWNRSNNIARASEKINGLVMMPGDEFSFNGVVGQRTAANGFAIAGVYVNGQVSNDYGGGICQVSSTIYNAVLRANLEVTDRSNHQFQVGYVPIGTDATVSWGSPDFKFKNNRNYPIKLVVYTENKNVYATIYGLHQEDDYTVKVISSQTGTVPYTTSYTSDSSLGPGEEKVVQSGSNGARSVTTKILYKNGEEVSRETVSTDYYSPHNQVIARGH